MESKSEDTFDQQAFIRDERMQDIEAARKEVKDLLELADQFTTHNPDFVPQIVDRVYEIKKEIELMVDSL